MPLTVDKRTSKQEDVVELVLLIVRNLVHCPNRREASITSDSLQDRCILSCQKVGILDLLVTLANDMEANDIFAGLIMEIVVYLLRDQTPEGLVNAEGSTDAVMQASERMRKKQEREVKIQKHLEKEARNAAYAKTYGSTRHSRFGGSFEVKATATDTKSKFYKQSISSLKHANRLLIDKGKQSRVKKKAYNAEVDNTNPRESSGQVRKILRQFCSSFLEDAYNLLMPAIYQSIKSNEGKGDKLMQYDEVHYCQMMRFFMEFQRLDTAKKRKASSATGRTEKSVEVGLIASTLRREDLKYVKELVMKFTIQFKEDSGGAVLWSQRLHHAIRALHEILLYLDELGRSSDEDQRDFSVSMQADLFYQFEFLETLPRLLKSLVPSKQSRKYMGDLVLIVHKVLKMVAALQKSSSFRFFTQRKSKKKKVSTATTKKTPEGPGAPAGDAGSTNATDAAASLVALFEDEQNKDGGKEGTQMVKGNEFEFDLDSYMERFADAKVIKFYTEVLKHYQTNGETTNHAIVKMLYRIADDKRCDKRWHLYQLSVLTLFDTIMADHGARKKGGVPAIRNFIQKGVLPRFFQDAADYPPLFMEVLFWKDADDISELQLGPAKAALLRRKKGFKWNTELEEALKMLHAKHAESGDDALEKITDELQILHPICEDRTEASVRSKLNKMKLPIASSAEWSQNDLEELRVAYGQLVDNAHDDPLQAIVESGQFTSKKATVGRLRNQLKKLGVAVAAKTKKRTVSPWSELEIMSLKELHDEFREMFRGVREIVDAIAEDPRMEDRGKMDIKKKLQELGLVKQSQPKKKKAEDEAPPRWTIGELDQDFAMNLHALAIKIRANGAGNVQQLSWLVHQMKAQIETMQGTDADTAASAAGGKGLVPDDTDAAKCLRPLVGMLGFLKMSDSDSEDDSDDEEAKGPQWVIPAGVPLTRLTAMEQVISMETLDMSRVTAEAPAASDDASQAETADTHVRAAKDRDASDSDSDSDDDGPPPLADVEADTDARKKTEAEHAAAAAQARKKAMEALLAKRKAGKKSRRELKAASQTDAAESALDAAESGWNDESETAAQGSEKRLSSTPLGSSKRRRLKALMDSSDEEDDEAENNSDTLPEAPALSLNTQADSSTADQDTAEGSTDASLSQGTSSQDQAEAAETQVRRTAQPAKRMIVDSDDDEDEDSEQEAPATLSASSTVAVPTETSSQDTSAATPATSHKSKRRRVVAIDSDDSDSDDDAIESDALAAKPDSQAASAVHELPATGTHHPLSLRSLAAAQDSATPDPAVAAVEMEQMS